ncbi:MAG: hypothetical protein Q9163_005544 [Psora crenata]
MSESHPRVDRSGSSNARIQQTSQGQPSSATLQSTKERSPYQSQGYSMNGTGLSRSAQPHYTPYQQQPNVSTQSQYGQSPRPGSGQALQRPSSTASAHGNHDLPGHLARVPSNHGPTNSARPAADGSNSFIPQTQIPPRATIGLHHTGKTSRNDEHALALCKHCDSPHADLSSPSTSATGKTLSNGKVDQQSTPVASQHPTTVDSDHVSNHYDYGRRQAEGTAARGAVEEAKMTAIAKALTSPQVVGQRSKSATSDDMTQAAKDIMGVSANANADSGSASKEQIKLDLKHMIEKMRDYKAKDPTLFSQVLEQCRKGQPSQAASSQPVAQGSTASPASSNGQLIGLTQADLPAESDFPAAATSSLEHDRGRYPMHRRKRGNKSYTPEKRPSHHHQKRTGSLNGEHTQSVSAGEGTATPARDSPAQNMHDAVQRNKHTSASSVPTPSISKPEPPKPSEAQNETPPPAGTTYWPEHKKRALAEAARLTLTSNPRNLGKTITSDEIHAILDRNPSYLQMCEHLESKGFVFERGPFARALLAAVPDMTTAATKNSAQPRTILPKPSQAPSIPSTALGLPNKEPFPRHRPIEYENLYMPLPPGQQQNLAPTNRNFVDRVPSTPQTELSHGSAAARGEHGALPQQSKQEKAKKRSFREIVDLTALPDDEEVTRHRPKPREDPIKPPSHYYGAQLHPAAPISGNSGGLQQSTPTHYPTGQPNLVPSQPRHSGREHLFYDIVVQPMNRRRDALRRSSYDPRTICKDILIASGKHPTMAPLNQHLESLRHKFVSVDHNADLSTFRWDLVDPGGHSPPKPVANHVAQRAAHNEAEKNDASIVNANATGPHYPRTATLGGDWGVGKGRPDVTVWPMNTSGEPRREGRPPNKSHPVNGLGRGVEQPTRTPQRTSSEVGTDASPVPIGTSSAPHPTISTPKPTSTVPTPSDIQIRVPRPRGRPPGARNKQPRVEKKGISKNSRLSQDANYGHATSPVPSHPQREPFTPVRSSGLRHTFTPARGIAVVIPSRSPSVAGSSPAKKAEGLIYQENSSDAETQDSPSRTYVQGAALGAHSSSEHRIDPLRLHSYSKLGKEYNESDGNTISQEKKKDAGDQSPTANKVMGGTGIYNSDSSLVTNSKRKILASYERASSEEIHKVEGPDGVVAGGAFRL